MVRSDSFVSAETPDFSQRVGVEQAVRASRKANGRMVRMATILALRLGDRHQLIALVAHAEGGQPVLGIEALRILILLPVEPRPAAIGPEPRTPPPRGADARLLSPPPAPPA